MKKFDFVIGNPPYQEETTSVAPKSNGQVRTKNIFPYFQEFADDIANEGIVLIYPGARWIHRSGKGTSKFGKNQINDKKLSKLVYYPNSKDVFKEVSISDGISIVIKNMNKNTDTFTYVYNNNGETITVNQHYPGENLIPLDPRDITIIKKLDLFVEKNNLKYLHERILPQKFYGIESNFIENNIDKTQLLTDGMEVDYETQVKLFANDKAGKKGRTKWFVVNKNLITNNTKYISEWQVVVSSANAGGQKRDNQIEIIDNHSAFGRSRLALGTFKTKEEAKNFFKYCESKIIKFAFLMTDENLTSLGKKVPDILEYTKFNNILDFTKDLDFQLKDKLELNENEYEHILDKVQGVRRR